MNPNEQLAAMAKKLAALEAENAALKAAPAKVLSYKVSEKGAVSVYGMGRFPVTLYKEQWVRLLAAGKDILAFIGAHNAELSTKADKVARDANAASAASAARVAATAPADSTLTVSAVIPRPAVVNGKGVSAL